MDYKSKLKSINSKLIISFTLIMIATILSIKLFVNTIFKDSFEKYVDDSNKVEVNHLIEFDLKNLYTNESWNTEFIENLGIEAIRKGIAIEIYDKNDNPSIITTKTAVISTIAIFIPPFVYIIIPQYE